MPGVFIAAPGVEFCKGPAATVPIIGCSSAGNDLSFA